MVHVALGPNNSKFEFTCGRGEIVEDVPPPLALGTPLLLVKPPVGLSTPAIFKALDLGATSSADPQDLLSSFQGGAQMAQELAVNDLEAPAFSMCVPRLGYRTEPQSL